MDETQENRRQRLREMIEEIGSQADFVRLTGQSQSEISRLLKDKSFGEKKARAIEQQAGYPAGWLDEVAAALPADQVAVANQSPLAIWIREARESLGWSLETASENLQVPPASLYGWESGRHEPSFGQVLAIARLSGLTPPVDGAPLILHPTRNSSDIPRGYVRLKMFDATPFMGGMGAPVDFPDVLKYVDMDRNHLMMELRVNPEHVCLLPVKGDSMSDTLESGDVVFVDQTVREFDGDGVYVLVWNHGLVVKRVQGMPQGGLRLKSDNLKYEAVELKPEETAHVTICGRVVGSWKVRRI